MRLRTVMLGSVLALVAITIAATALTVQLVFERSTRAALDRKLEVHRQIFLGMLAQHQALLAREAKILADEPRLKAVLGGDVDRATVVGVARDIMAMVRSDLFLVIDSEGLLVVDLLDPAVSGVDMMGDVLIAEAFHQGGSSGMWTADSGLYEVQAQRVRAGPHIVGAVVIGRRIDDTMATSLQRRTGTSLLILHRDGRPQLDRGVDGDRIQLEHSAIVASPLPGVGDVDRAGIAAAVAAQLERSGAAPVAGGAAGLGSMTIGEAEFATLSARFPGSYRGSDHLTYVVLENIDTALAPSHRVTRILGAIALVVFLAAIILAMMLTRQLSDPIDRLVELTEHLAAGDLSARAKSCGFVEVSQLGVAMNRMASELEQSRYTLAEKQRLENELDIAHRIQTSIVPDGIELPGLTVAARMETAELVGGDYYDLQPASDGGWIAIGDVAGHGLQAGLVMMMAQTSLASLIAAQPAASPAELLVTLNRTLYENVKDRMALDRHMTLSVARYCSDGRLIVAGAHLDILHLSADGESPRSIEIPGTWIALLPDIAPVTMDTTIELAPGDLVVLYTDGVIEARDRDGEMFGIDRMCQLICDHRNETPDQLCEHLLTRVHDWVDPEAPREPGRSGCDDDLTVVILRYTGPGGPEAAGDADEPGGAMA